MLHRIKFQGSKNLEFKRDIRFAQIREQADKVGRELQVYNTIGFQGNILKW